MPRKRTTNIKGRGGWRPGAGRKKGRVNKFSVEDRERALADGEKLPLDYMLHVMRSPHVPKARRDAMAIAAAPYLHHKLSSVELKNKKGEALRMITEKMSPQEAAEAYASALVQPTAYDDETKH